MDMISTIILQPLQRNFNIRHIIFRLLYYFQFSSQFKVLLELAIGVPISGYRLSPSMAPDSVNSHEDYHICNAITFSRIKLTSNMRVVHPVPLVHDRQR